MYFRTIILVFVLQPCILFPIARYASYEANNEVHFQKDSPGCSVHWLNKHPSLQQKQQRNFWQSFSEHSLHLQISIRLIRSVDCVETHKFQFVCGETDSIVVIANTQLIGLNVQALPFWPSRLVSDSPTDWNMRKLKRRVWLIYFVSYVWNVNLEFTEVMDFPHRIFGINY